jgi:hypothetical protein
MCPPGALPLGEAPPIIVASLMRSGTHLVIDLILNNLASYRRDPLYVDFDAYMFEGHDPAALSRMGGCVVKTHVPQRPLDQAAMEVLKKIAKRSLVIIPIREPEGIEASLRKWEGKHCHRDIAEQQRELLAFWLEFDPMVVRFADLLVPELMQDFLTEVTRRLALPLLPKGYCPIVAASSRPRTLMDKLLTRTQGYKTAVVNTTVGYKL